jgi:hypothetical protein
VEEKIENLCIAFENKKSLLIDKWGNSMAGGVK